MSTPYYENKNVTLWHGDCLDVLRTLPDNSVDAVVTDPPYSLSFMGKGWDKFRDVMTFQQWCEAWSVECLRVLKPGGHLLAFGGTRTWHRLACAIEDAGFEIRDSIAWLTGQGFPKSTNALKPAFSPIVVGRKPLIGTVSQNVLTHGTGALNIDGCRVASNDTPEGRTRHGGGIVGNGSSYELPDIRPTSPAGRWPANVVLDGSQADALDAQTGILTGGRMPAGTQKNGKAPGIYGEWKPELSLNSTPGDSGGASRFFPTFRYEAKAPTSERPRIQREDGTWEAHPTVKPLNLMRWLVRLVTPPGGTVLDPFAGSGTTAEACVIEGFQGISIEREADYLPLIVQRLSKLAAIPPTSGA